MITVTVYSKCACIHVYVYIYRYMYMKMYTGIYTGMHACYDFLLYSKNIINI